MSKRIRYARVVHDPKRRRPWIVRRTSIIGVYEYWLGRKIGMGFLGDDEHPNARIVSFKTREEAKRVAGDKNDFERLLAKMYPTPKGTP